jgi:hypothetical protein
VEPAQVDLSPASLAAFFIATSLVGIQMDAGFLTLIAKVIVEAL